MYELRTTVRGLAGPRRRCAVSGAGFGVTASSTRRKRSASFMAASHASPTGSRPSISHSARAARSHVEVSGASGLALPRPAPDIGLAPPVGVGLRGSMLVRAFGNTHSSVVVVPLSLSWP